MTETSTGLPKAQAVFIPRGVVLNGPPMGFRSWKEPGAILSWLRLKGFDAEVFVNWTRARPAQLPEYKPPYAPGPGYWVYYYGPEPTAKALRRVLQ
jgi:hypothetical protein